MYLIAIGRNYELFLGKHVPKKNLPNIHALLWAGKCSFKMFLYKLICS